MLRQRLSEKSPKIPYYYGTPRTHNLKEERPVLSERAVALWALVVSLLIIAAKVFTGYRETIGAAVLEQNNFWLPAVCGVLSSYFTWIMVYLDSNVPGISPPSPLSPQKYKDRSGHTFHLNYVFAILVGIFVFFYMYFKGVSVQY
ncbi:hypothetical protein NQ318_002793 [Aromia moschata]|uniref:Uncharacterized protein n=1 Tax=Aromia moschata TaxID=1265417 RepID=A0AAV8XU96_9CUCU|nr:hypothetical protein NQ318_002793 [Aromia moschata]